MNKIYSVQQINSYVKNMFTQDYLLGSVSVRGEVTNCKDHPSGHIYFTLKDQNAVLSCVMFAGNRGRGLKCVLKDGMQVVVSGSVDTYEAAGKYQLYTKTIEEEGIGNLYQEFLDLKKRLEESGMFDTSYKKEIPKYVRTLGIVTSDSGAAVHDIIQIANRRNPSVQLVLCPAKVQGEHAAESIVRAIERLDALHLDAMIVGRGGGSFEDLFVFNDESVARAIFDCETPVISAVGHETDFTIADFVSDLRAPTPSAAAELAVWDREFLKRELLAKERRMGQKLLYRIEEYKRRVRDKEVRLRKLDPEKRLIEEKQRIRMSYERLERLLKEKFEARKNRLSLLSERLSGVSPLGKLKGGYGYISRQEKPVCSVSEVSLQDELEIRLQDGRIKTRVSEIVNE